MAAERTFTVYGGMNVLEGPIRPLFSGAMFPLCVQVTLLEMSDHDTKVTLTLRSIDGRAVLVGVSVAPFNIRPFVGRELAATELHDLPIKKLVDMAVRAVGAQCADPRTGPGRGDPVAESVLAARSQRRRGLSDEELREVARVVAENPGAGTAAVYDQLAAPQYYSYRTAARWVADARERRFIPSTDEED